MKIKITLWYLCVSLCINISNSKATFIIATDDSANANSLHLDAIIEIEKQIFNCKNNDSLKEFLILAKAKYQKKIGLYNAEIKTLARINYNYCTDSTICVIYYENALALYITSNFKKANDFLERAHSLPINTSEYKNSIFLHGLVCNELFDYKNAKEKFNEYFKSSNRVNAINIDSLYSIQNIPKLKSLSKARRMSLFLPSAGLFYAKCNGKAISNLTLLMLSVAYTGYNISILNYYTAISSGFYFMKYFYVGGVNQLNVEIPKYNTTITQKFNQSVKKILIN